MRTIFSKLTFFPCLFAIVSCNYKSKTIENSENTSHDYGEISSHEIMWKDLFSIGIPQYFVYFYSPTCSHCNEIKQTIIEYALSDERMYFVKYSDEITISPFVGDTIGATTIEEVSIMGTPSLIEITDGVLTKNIAGTNAILKFLDFTI